MAVAKKKATSNKSKKIQFESDGFFTPNDKKAIKASLKKKNIGKSEKRSIAHGRTLLTVQI